jgi:MFS family permease
MLDAHPHDSPKYLGILHGCFGIGGLAAPLVISAMLTAATWRGVYFSFGVSLLAAFIVVFFIYRSSSGAGKESAPAPAEAKLTRADISDYLGHGRNWILICCSIMAFTTQTGIIVWIMRYLAVRFGDDSLGSLSISLYWVFLTINRFLAPRLPVKPMKLFTVGSALFAAAMFIGIALDSPAALCAAIAVGGMTSGHLIPVLISECAAGYEGKSTLTTSVVTLSMCASRIATPLLMAYLTAAASPVAGMLTVPVSGALAAAFGLAALKTKAPERSGA